MCGGQVWVEDAFDLHSELHVFESVGGMGDIVTGLDKLKDQIWRKWIKKLRSIRLRF